MTFTVLGGLEFRAEGLGLGFRVRVESSGLRRRYLVKVSALAKVHIYQNPYEL